MRTQTRFRYLQWSETFKHEKPFEVLIDLPVGTPPEAMTNMMYQEAELEVVEDARGLEAELKLDSHGFEYIKHSSVMQKADFAHRDKLLSLYLPECEELLKTTLDGADYVHIFNWRASTELDYTQTMSLTICSSVTHRDLWGGKWISVMAWLEQGLPKVFMLVSTLVDYILGAEIL